LCSKHGQVIGCQIRMDADGNSLGKALVTFNDKEHALIASQKLYFEDELGANIDIEFFQHDLKMQKIYK